MNTSSKAEANNLKVVFNYMQEKKLNQDEQGLRRWVGEVGMAHPRPTQVLVDKLTL